MTSSREASAVAHPILSYQPFTLLYQIFRVTTILARLPFWLLKFLLPAFRPHPSWTFKQAVARNLIYHIGNLNSTIGRTIPLPLTPGKEGARWATTDPFTDELYVGPLVSARIRPVEIGGTWYGVPCAPATAASAKHFTRVALHLHGGAFVIGDGRQGDTAFLGKTLVECARFEAVFVPQYRLAGYGGRDPFPAALQDAVTSYLYLIRTLGINPEYVTVSGDSAGGNLAIGLLRYLERYGAQINVPKLARVALVSPWVNPSWVLHEDTNQWELDKTDYLPESFPLWGATTYVQQSDNVSEGSEWVDPLGHPFKTDTPVFLVWAEREKLSVDCARWAEEWKGAGNGKLTTHLEKNAPHDSLLLGHVSGWDATARETCRQMARWVDVN